MNVWKNDLDGEKISVADAAEYLECTATRVLELLREGQLPGMKYGKAWVIPRAAFFDAVNVAAVQAQAVLFDEAKRRKVSPEQLERMVPKKRPGRPRFPR